MKVINLLDVLKDTVKTEEAMPGMQAEEGHHHGYSRFADSDVQDRTCPIGMASGSLFILIFKRVFWTK